MAGWRHSGRARAIFAEPASFPIPLKSGHAQSNCVEHHPRWLGEKRYGAGPRRAQVGRAVENKLPIGGIQAVDAHLVHAQVGGQHKAVGGNWQNGMGVGAILIGREDAVPLVLDHLAGLGERATRQNGEDGRRPEW